MNVAKKWACDTINIWKNYKWHHIHQVDHKFEAKDKICLHEPNWVLRGRTWNKFQSNLDHFKLWNKGETMVSLSWKPKYLFKTLDQLFDIQYSKSIRKYKE